MDASLISQMKAIEDENRRLKQMYTDLSVQADLLNYEGERHFSQRAGPGPWKKATGPSQRCELAKNAVAQRGASIALAYRAFGVSKYCYRDGPKLRAENEQIADLLVGLTDARKTGGWPVFHVSSQCQRDLWNLCDSEAIHRYAWTKLGVETLVNLLKHERIRCKMVKPEKAGNDVFDFIEFFSNPKHKQIQNVMP